jgi:hypothetical protein
LFFISLRTATEFLDRRGGTCYEKPSVRRLQLAFSERSGVCAFSVFI